MSRMSLRTQSRGVRSYRNKPLAKTLIFQRERYMSWVRIAKNTPRGADTDTVPQIRLFPSKMTAFGLKTAGEDSFNAGQPTGGFLSSSHSPTCV